MDLRRYETAIAGAIAMLSVCSFLFCWYIFSHGDKEPLKLSMAPTPVHRKIIPVDLPAIHPKMTMGTLAVIARSPKVFAYAHGTAAADGRLFIGMADKDGNPFLANVISAFGNANDISLPVLVSMKPRGDIETMVYDSANDKLYFLLSSNRTLSIYGMDPHTYTSWPIATTSAVDAGRKPAIATDGAYIYGITDADPSVVFKVGVNGGALATSSTGHISNGHSAAVGAFGSTTELYFGGGMSDGFEKADAATLAPISKIKIDPCGMSDDMPFAKANDSTGYVYIGCESVPYGIRVKTNDMSYERFSLPGASLGLFIYGNDLYNAAEDGAIDIFPGADLTNLHRYKLSDTALFGSQEPGLNEILYSRETNRLFVTAWWGIRGLFEVSTSTSNI